MNNTNEPTVTLDKYLEMTDTWNSRVDRAFEIVEKWHARYLETAKERDEALKQLSRLAGERFSNRDHMALRSRAESAEKRCIELHRWIAQWRSRMGDHECWCKNGESTECQVELEMRRVLEGELVSGLRLGDVPLGFADTMGEFYARIYKRMGEWEKDIATHVGLRTELRALLAEWHNRDRGLVGVANGNA